MEKKLRILVVEDDHDTLEMYAEVFRAQNMDVLTALDGAEGLEVATKELPDVIFTGISMPRMDGFGLMEALKRTESTANIPVVISSHLGKESDRQRSMELGARDFIVRGFTPPKQVADKIKTLFVEREIYRLLFDPVAMDAPRLAKDLELDPDFKCPACEEKMALEMRVKNSNEKTFEARLICPKCG